MATFEEAEKYAQALAAREITRNKMRGNVRAALADRELVEALRAQAWLEAEPSRVSITNGKVSVDAEGWPLGCGSEKSEVMARIQRRWFPDDAEREAYGWMFELEGE